MDALVAPRSSLLGLEIAHISRVTAAAGMAYTTQRIDARTAWPPRRRWDETGPDPLPGATRIACDRPTPNRPPRRPDGGPALRGESRRAGA